MCTNFRGFNFRGDACPRKLVPKENFYVYGSSALRITLADQSVVYLASSPMVTKNAEGRY